MVLRKEEHSMLAEFLDDNCKENLVLKTNYYPMVRMSKLQMTLN